MSETRYPATPESLLRNLLHGLDLVLERQGSWQTPVNLPRFVIQEWRRLAREALRLLVEH